MSRKGRQEQANFMHVDDLGGLEVLQATYRRQTFSRHSHEGFCVGVIDEGAQRFYRTGGEHVAPLGSVILVNADDIHTGSSASEDGWSYQAMYPKPELLAFLSRDLKTVAGATPYFPNPVVQDAGLAGQLRLAFGMMRSNENRLVKETLVFSALTWLMLRHGKSRIVPAVQSKAQSQIARIKAFLDDFPEANISLLELAEKAGLSPYYLLRQFQQVTGLPPHAYQIQARLRKGRQLLKAGNGVLETALACGFHDQSHFHRHFRKSIGVTPGDYVKSLR
ncbi:AraC family transcriptional regulator [Serratia sp. JSRIV001]|uniref:Arabinose operon regulatory protein n=2 Tax=Serratia TaxID=613 RepID=A0AAP7F8B0_SERFO|nr:MULTISPECIES: AraC family transcriptional regulator [Serratia]ALX94234.1 AraC family transcriptional regulator [Serratia fonticola]MBC3213169.1 AraC family transcriptional regulator [Serratia fonticola]MBC3380578.1 AraC family transcriptional regulator [Serratia fonticola]MBP1035411.1 AraC family transcriptional regulator [Serratia fonticola]NYA13266.1 AraC family transcriptional regulator [Serratia fonticola]